MKPRMKTVLALLIYFACVGLVFLMEYLFPNKPFGGH